MFELLTRLFNQALIAACCLSLVLVFVSLAGVLRLLPALLPYVRVALRLLLVLSIRFYTFALGRLAPLVEQYLGVNILAGLPRVVASTILSLSIGLTFCVLTQSPVTIWNLGLFLIHGLVVGFVWDGIEEPDELLLGVRTQ